MSAEKTTVTVGGLNQTVKKRKLEEIKEDCEILIVAEAEKFIVLFGKTFIEQEPLECAARAARAADIAAKVVSKIKEKIDGTISKNTVGRLIKLILNVVKIILKANGENEND